MPRNSPRPMRTQLTFTREDPVTGDELATLVAIVRYDPGSDNRITRDGPEVGDAESITCDSYRVTGQADQAWVDSILEDEQVLLEKFHEDNPPGPLGYDR
jgi:hypothetical protein